MKNCVGQNLTICMISKFIVQGKKQKGIMGNPNTLLWPDKMVQKLSKLGPVNAILQLESIYLNSDGAKTRHVRGNWVPGILNMTTNTQPLH